MIFNISDCSIRCWECEKECNIKLLFELPEFLFNQTIIDSLKADAGMFIAGGGNPRVADTELKKTAVCLSISRKKYLENLKKN